MTIYHTARARLSEIDNYLKRDVESISAGSFAALLEESISDATIQKQDVCALSI